jgi:hypothetical protein
MQYLFIYFQKHLSYTTKWNLKDFNNVIFRDQTWTKIVRPEYINQAVFLNLGYMYPRRNVKTRQSFMMEISYCQTGRQVLKRGKHLWNIGQFLRNYNTEQHSIRRFIFILSVVGTLNLSWQPENLYSEVSLHERSRSLNE